MECIELEEIETQDFFGSTSYRGDEMRTNYIVISYPQSRH